MPEVYAFVAVRPVRGEEYILNRGCSIVVSGSDAWCRTSCINESGFHEDVGFGHAQKQCCVIVWYKGSFLFSLGVFCIS